MRTSPRRRIYLLGTFVLVAGVGISFGVRLAQERWWISVLDDDARRDHAIENLLERRSVPGLEAIVETSLDRLAGKYETIDQLSLDLWIHAGRNAAQSQIRAVASPLQQSGMSLQQRNNLVRAMQGARGAAPRSRLASSATTEFLDEFFSVGERLAVAYGRLRAVELSTPVLVRALESDSSPKRVLAARRLREFSLGGRESTLRPLEKVVKNEQWAVRIQGFLGFVDAGPAATDYTPRLIEGLRDAHANVRWAAVRALGELALGRPSPAESIVSALVSSLRDGDRLVPSEAILSLSRYGSRARASLPALRKLVDADDPLAYLAASAIASIATPNDQAARKTITGALGRKSSWPVVLVQQSKTSLPRAFAASGNGRVQAFRAAARLGEDASVVLKSFQEQSADRRTPGLPRFLGSYVARRGVAEPPVLETLKRSFTLAQVVYGDIPDRGPRPKELLSAGWEVTRALGVLGTPAIPSLHEFLSGFNYDSRLHAARALAWIGAKEEGGLRALHEGLSAIIATRDTVHFRVIEGEAVGHEGSAERLSRFRSKSPVELLAEVLHHEEESWARALVARLCAYRARSSSVIDAALVERLRDSSKSVRAAAAFALAHRPRRENVEALSRALLEESKRHVHLRILRALGAMAAPGSETSELARSSLQNYLGTHGESALERGEVLRLLAAAGAHVAAEPQFRLELSSPDSRARGLEVLARYPNAEIARAMLKDPRREASPLSRAFAASAYWGVGRRDKVVRGEMKRALSDGWTWDRHALLDPFADVMNLNRAQRAAMRALVTAGVELDQFAGELRRGLDSPDPLVRILAARAVPVADAERSLADLISSFDPAPILWTFLVDPAYVDFMQGAEDVEVLREFRRTLEALSEKGSASATACLKRWSRLPWLREFQDLDPVGRK
ncbi:MAG: HEAT repeat domain-containing protein [Planctomycetota bacterium]